LGLPTWSAQITRSGAVPNDEANDQAVVQIGGYLLARLLFQFDPSTPSPAEPPCMFIHDCEALERPVMPRTAQSGWRWCRC
jgi:hypothetical protein